MITREDADKAIAYVKAGLAEFEGKVAGVEAKPWMVKSEKLTLKCLEFAKKWAGAEEIRVDRINCGQDRCDLRDQVHVGGHILIKRGG